MNEDNLKWIRGRIRAWRRELHKRLYVLMDPVQDLGEAEFVALQRADNETVSIQSFDVDVKAIEPKENVGDGEGNPLVTVDEAVVVAERFHQRSRFFFDGIVVASLRTKNGGLDRAFVADAMKTAEHLD